MKSGLVGRNRHGDVCELVLDEIPVRLDDVAEAEELIRERRRKRDPHGDGVKPLSEMIKDISQSNMGGPWA